MKFSHRIGLPTSALRHYSSTMHLSRHVPKAPYVCARCTLRIATVSDVRNRRYGSTIAAYSFNSPRTRSPRRSIAPQVLTHLGRSHIRHNGYSTSTPDRKRLRIAIIGSGPAGFYTAYRLMSKVQEAVVDMYEQLPVPYGLVRFGVAPDHPDVKNCQDTFEKVALSPRFNYIGNVRVGHDIELSKLKPHYDAILFSYGASEDRKLGIPGEALPGVFSAREFVGWYNGLPQFQGLRPELKAGEQAVVIGQGNVAMDVARILLTSVDALRSTDITEQAIQTLSENQVRSVRVVGRRGPIQVTTTLQVTLRRHTYSPTGCIHNQRSSRADAHPIRRLQTDRSILLPTRHEEAPSSPKAHSRRPATGNTINTSRLTKVMGPRLSPRPEVHERIVKPPVLHNLHTAEVWSRSQPVRSSLTRTTHK